MIQYAIPSYRRADVCASRTVATLRRLGVDDSQMTIFVADDADSASYASAISGVRIVKGVPGLIHQRRFYNGYYPKGERIVNADDDLYDLKFVTKSGKLKQYDGKMNDVADYAFKLCESCGAKLWGISAVENGFYMDRSTSAGLRYICGILHGSYADDPVMSGNDRPLMSSGEDFETTLRSFRRYGVVVRLDWLCPRTKYFAPGGMQAELGGRDELRQAEHTKELKAIANRHAGMCSVYEKSGGVTNLRLKTMKSVKYTVPLALLPEE
jgi:hypothetical protein